MDFNEWSKLEFSNHWSFVQISPNQSISDINQKVLIRPLRKQRRAATNNDDEFAAIAKLRDYSKRRVIAQELRWEGLDLPQVDFRSNAHAQWQSGQSAARHLGLLVAHLRARGEYSRLSRLLARDSPPNVVRQTEQWSEGPFLGWTKHFPGDLGESTAKSDSQF